MAADLLSDEQISDFKDAFTLFDTGRILFFFIFFYLIHILTFCNRL
jgi:hypothetical protein